MFQPKLALWALVVVLSSRHLAGEEIESFEFPDFSDLSAFVFLGSTANINQAGPVFYDDQPVLRLTDELWQAGGAFLVFSVALKAGTVPVSFSTYFQFQITDPCGLTESFDGVQGADGIVLVFARENNILGGLGGGLGYLGIPNSVGIEIDTWNNTGNPAVDPNNGNHIGIDLDGIVNSVATAEIPTPLNNGNVWHVWVDYNGRDRILEVRISESPDKPSSANLTHALDIVTSIGDEGYLGFTSGTGAACNDHDIRSWTFSSWIPAINQPPQITHTPITTIEKGKEILFSFDVTDDQNQIQSIAIYTRLVGTQDYLPTPVAPNPQGTHYDVGISGLTETLTGVEYYIEARDVQGLAATHGTREAPHRVCVTSDRIGLQDQLFIFDHSQKLFKEVRSNLCLFNPSYPTMVFVHGWNRVKILGKPEWEGDLNGNPKGDEHPWRKMARDISGRWTPEINILAWDWFDIATAFLPPGYAVYDQAGLLVVQLKVLFDAKNHDPNQPLHLLGHSLGAHIVAWTAVDEKLYAREKEGKKVSRVDQLTYFDPPGEDIVAEAGYSLSDICNSTQYLRDTSPDTYVEMVTGTFSINAHNAHLYINPPGTGHFNYEWYHKTIEQGLDGMHPCLFSSSSTQKFSDTIGFAISPVLGEKRQERPEPDESGNAGFTTFICADEEPASSQCSQIIAEDCSTDPNFAFIERARWNNQCEGCGTILHPDPRCERLESFDRITLTINTSTHTISAEDLSLWSSLNFNLQFNNANSTQAILEVKLINPKKGQGQGGGVEEDLVLFTVSFDAIGEELQTIPEILIPDDAKNYAELEFHLTTEDPLVSIEISNVTYLRHESFGNLPPTANAGADQTVRAEIDGLATVMLSGTQSKDPENRPLHFMWLMNDAFLGDTEEIELTLQEGRYQVSLIVTDEFNIQSLPDEVLIAVLPFTKPGDANRDDAVDISDAIYVLGCLFVGTPCPEPLAIADFNCSGVTDISDPIYLLSFLFIGGLPPQHCF